MMTMDWCPVCMEPRAVVDDRTEEVGYGPSEVRVHVIDLECGHTLTPA